MFLNSLFKTPANAIHNTIQGTQISQSDGHHVRKIGTVVKPIKGGHRGRVKYHGSFYFGTCPDSSTIILEGQFVEVIEETGVYLTVIPIDP